MSRCTHDNARRSVAPNLPDRFHERWLWCPDCRQFVTPDRRLWRT